MGGEASAAAVVARPPLSPPEVAHPPDSRDMAVPMILEIWAEEEEGDTDRGRRVKKVHRRGAKLKFRVHTILSSILYVSIASTS